MLNAVEAGCGIGAVAGAKTKTTAELLPKLKVMVNRIMAMCGVKSHVHLRVHSDVDNSLLADITDWVQTFGGSRTTTEGYDHDGNAKIESRNAKTKQAMRVMLLDCAGGNRQYEELVIPACLLAVHGFNYRGPRANGGGWGISWPSGNPKQTMRAPGWVNRGIFPPI